MASPTLQQQCIKGIVSSMILVSAKDDDDPFRQVVKLCGRFMASKSWVAGTRKNTAKHTRFFLAFLVMTNLSIMTATWKNMNHARVTPEVP